MLTHVSLFTGIGGIDLAAEWAGFTTVAMVEKDAYCQKVLRKHWPDVPILEDIFDVNRQTLADAQQSRRDGSTRPRDGGRVEQQQGRENQSEGVSQSQAGNPFASLRPPGDGTEFSVDLISGGFPCQPFSVAGQRKGKEDDRYLWPEMLRVIREVRPTWAVCENVAGLIHMGLDDCLADLESSGYEVQTFQIPACAVNAPHRRDRIFIVAHLDSVRCDGWRPSGEGIPGRRQSCREVGAGSPMVADAEAGTERAGLRESRQTGERGRRPSHSGGEDVADAECEPVEGNRPTREQESTVGREDESPEGGQSVVRGREHGTTQSCLGRVVDELPYRLDGHWWDREPDIPRVATGVKHRVDQLRALGNAVVPQQIYPILKAIADIERAAAGQ